MKLLLALLFLIPVALAYNGVLLQRDDLSDSSEEDSIQFVDIDSRIRSHRNNVYVTLVCSGQFDLKKVHFKWLKDGVEIPNADPLDSNYRFKLTPLSRRTLGHYQCAVQSDDTNEEAVWSYSPDMEIKVPHVPRRHKRFAELPPCSVDDDCKDACTKMAKKMVSAGDRDNVRATWKCEARKCACGAVL